MTQPGEPDELVARAIERVLEAVPGVPDEPPDLLDKYQPWADKASPSARGKRPLQELLDEIAERVAAEPGARAAAPGGPPPGIAYFERFSEQPEARRSRRRRPSRGRGGPESSAGRTTNRGRAAPAQPPEPRIGGPEEPGPVQPAAGRAGRRRRRRGSGGGGAGPPRSGATG